MIGKVALAGALALGGCAAAIGSVVVAVPPPPTPPAGRLRPAARHPSNLTASQWAVARTAAAVAAGRQLADSQVLTSIYAAGLVESELKNLPYGDRDSLGVWQERPSQGWGTAAQIMDVSYAAGEVARRDGGRPRLGDDAAG